MSLITRTDIKLPQSKFLTIALSLPLPPLFSRLSLSLSLSLYFTLPVLLPLSHRISVLLTLCLSLSPSVCLSFYFSLSLSLSLRSVSFRTGPHMLGVNLKRTLWKTSVALFKKKRKRKKKKKKTEEKHTHALCIKLFIEAQAPALTVLWVFDQLQHLFLPLTSSPSSSFPLLLSLSDKPRSPEPRAQSPELTADHLFKVHALKNTPCFPFCHVALCSD